MRQSFPKYLSARWRWSIKGVGGVASGVSFAIGAIIAAAIWKWPDVTHAYLSERMNAFVSGLIPLLAGGSVFAVRWAISPYYLYKSQTEQIGVLQKAENDELEEAFYSIVKWITHGHYPLYALQEHEVDEFRTNDLVVRLCDLLVQHGHPHPFESVKSTCLQSDWLSFLKWARGRGIKFYAATDTYSGLVQFLKERVGRPVTEMPSAKPPEIRNSPSTHRKDSILDEDAPRFIATEPRMEYAEVVKKLSVSYRVQKRRKARSQELWCKAFALGKFS